MTTGSLKESISDSSTIRIHNNSNSHNHNNCNNRVLLLWNLWNCELEEGYTSNIYFGFHDHR